MTTPSTTEEWEEDYKKLIVHRAIEISAHGIFVIRDFIKLLLTSREAAVRREERNKMIESVEEVRTRIRCAACDSARCNHTLLCRGLVDLITNLKDSTD